MKKHLYKLTAVLMAAAMLLLAVGCGGGNNAQSAPASGSAASDAGNGVPETPDAPEAPDEGAGDAAAQPAAPEMDIEQYKEMAAKFAFFCDSVYFDYQGERGTVTILDIEVEEDTEAQCRIRVYYQEPELVDTNSWTAATDGYMIFAVDKATGQGRMECWEFLGEPGDYLPETVDQMDVAVGYSWQLVDNGFYSGFPYEMDDVYDFGTGTILSSGGEVKADVKDYWNANSLQ